MSTPVQLVDDKGRSQIVNICLSSLVGDTKKKVGGQENANWTCNSKVLKNERTFKSYDVEENDVILTSEPVIGGIIHLIIGY
jgi:hypothetical protein